jgi:hypothetical protein
MQAAVTQKLVTTLRTQAKAGEIPKPIEVRDPDIKGFILRVQPSGTAAYIIQLARAKRLTIGDAAILTPAQARQKAKAALGALAEGRDPRTALKAAETAQVATLGAFIEDHYLPWAKANRKSGDATVARIRACFLAEFGDTPIDRLTPMALERWRLGRLQQGGPGQSGGLGAYRPSPAGQDQAWQGGHCRRGPLPEPRRAQSPVRCPRGPRRRSQGRPGPR